MATYPSTADRVRQQTSTTGTGPISITSNVPGFQTFADAFLATTTIVYYCIADANPTDWEVGIGTYTRATNVLARDTVLSSSAAGSLVSFGAGPKDVFVTMPAGEMAKFNKYHVGLTPPPGPSSGDKWLCNSDGIEYTYVVEGNSKNWVDLYSGPVVVNRIAAPVYITSTQPTDLGTYFWVQTGLDNDDITLWLNVESLEVPANANNGRPIYIGPIQPADATEFIWFQTGLGEDGTDFTMWVNM